MLGYIFNALALAHLFSVWMADATSPGTPESSETLFRRCSMVTHPDLRSRSSRETLSFASRSPRYLEDRLDEVLATHAPVLRQRRMAFNVLAMFPRRVSAPPALPSH